MQEEGEKSKLIRNKNLIKLEIYQKRKNLSMKTAISMS